MLCVLEYGYSRHYRVRTTAEAGEHLSRVVWIVRFAQDVVLQDNDRIRAEHDRGRELPGDAQGFRICYPPGIDPRHFIGQNAFIDMRRKHRKRYSELGQ